MNINLVPASGAIRAKAANVKDELPAGAQARRVFVAFVARLNRVRKKARYASKKPEEHTSGPKGPLIRLGLPGINPRPTGSILGLPDKSPAYRTKDIFLRVW